jgi:perosamine synthetase
MSLSDFERHGASPTTFETYPEVGYNFRMTDIQAGVGVAQMNRLDDILERRRRIAARYVDALKQHPFLIPPFAPAHVEPNWQSFQVRIREDSPLTRDQIMERLHESGIATRRGVMASHLEPPYRGLGSRLPNTETLAEWAFQLPIFPDLSEVDVDYVIERLLALGSGLA